MTAPRIIVAGATTAITRRTTLRKAFLAPWHPLVGEIWQYALAYAQQQTGVAVHHGICVITHHHLTVTPQARNLPEFTHLFHKEVSRALNALLARERYDQPRELFDGRKPHYMRLLDAPAQATQIVYEHSNCVAAGLVNRPEHMPGTWFDFDLWKRGYLDVERPDVYFSDELPDVIRLQVTPPPLLFEAFGGDLDRLVHHMRRTSECAARTLRAARNRPPLGAQRIMRLHPWSEPRTLRESGGRRVPTFRIGARGILGRKLAVDAATETREFRRQYADARSQWCTESREHRFPYGTYAMRVQHAAAVEPAPCPGALITQPGPLLCDVIAQLEALAVPRDAVRAHTFELLDEVQNAFEEEAAELCQDAQLDFDHAQPSGNDSTATVAARHERTAVQVRHRFDPHAASQSASSSRVIVLRDRRRGRPSASAHRHGADPPD
jgi:putative transposase